MRQQQQAGSVKWRLQPFDMEVQFYPARPETKLVFTFTNKEIEEAYEAVLKEKELRQDLKHEFDDLQTLFLYIKENHRVEGIVGIGDDFSIQVTRDKGVIAEKKRYKHFVIPTLKLKESQPLINQKLFRELNHLTGKVDKAVEKMGKTVQSPRFTFFRFCVLLLVLYPFYYLYYTPRGQGEGVVQQLASLQQRVKYFQEGLINKTVKSVHPVYYSFSKDKKGKQILISENGKFCTKTVNNQYQYVIIEQSLGMRDTKISLSIVKSNSYISFGLATLDYLQSIKMGGTSGNKQTYGINNSKQVMQVNLTERTNTAFSISMNDIIYLEVIEQKLMIRKAGEPAAVVLDVQFSEEQWERAVVFVNLYAAGDSVGILN